MFLLHFPSWLTDSCLEIEEPGIGLEGPSKKVGLLVCKPKTKIALAKNIKALGKLFYFTQTRLELKFLEGKLDRILMSSSK